MEKHNENLRGTGGGKGEPLTDAENNAMSALVSRKSDLVSGIEGESEVGLPDTNATENDKEVQNLI